MESKRGVSLIQKKFLSIVKKSLKKSGFTNITVKNNYYYFSGFATSPSGKILYVSSGDTRTSSIVIFFRTAESYSDFSGGVNTFPLSYTEDGILSHISKFI